MTHAKPIWPLYATASLLLLSVACGGPPEAQPDVGTPTMDAGASDARDSKADDPNQGTMDGGGDDQDVSSADMATADAGDTGYLFAGDWVDLELNDGSTVSGELVATYDTSVWWNPLGGDLYALFDATRYAAYPNDRSMQFVLETDVAAMERGEPPTPRPTYTDFLRNNDIAFSRPPFEDVSYVITAHETYHLEEDGFGNFAWDMEITDETGAWYTGAGTANEDFLVWGAPVYSGVSGTVIDVIQNGPDNTPGSHPDRDTAINNWVGIALGGHFYAYYLHFQEDGVDPAIEIGSAVSVGDRLGVTGNSGVSLEPHMHVVLLWYDVDAERSYSVPIEWNDVEVAESPTGPFTRYDWWVPDSEEWLRP